MEKLITALATDDGKTYTNQHFGDALYFDIYELFHNKAVFLKRVENTTEQEEENHEHHHGDHKKAGGITRIMKQNNVNVLVAKVFGPNIKKVKKHFVCVFMDDTDIANSLTKLQRNYDLLEKEWLRGEVRDFIHFKKLS